VAKFAPTDMKASAEAMARALKEKSLSAAVAEVARHLRLKYSRQLEELVNSVVIRAATREVAKELDLTLEE